MLPGGTDPTYRAILASGGSWTHRIEVWLGGVRVDPWGDAGMPIVSGGLSATLGNRVTRQVSITGDRRLWPMAATGLLAPFGAQLRIHAGVRSGGGTPFWFEVFRGPITDLSMTRSSMSVQLSAADLVELVIADQFLSPRDSGAGALVSARFRDLINDTIPDAEFDNVYESFAVVEQATWDSDRAGTIDTLATGTGCFWYTTPSGAFTMRPVPWSVVSYGAPLATIGPTTGLIDAMVSWSRSQVYNVVSVTGEAANGSDPVVGSWSNLDGSSPTCATGLLGRRVKRLSGQQVSDVQQAQSVARRYLRGSQSASRTWSTTTNPDPSLELGDVCLLTDGEMSDLGSLSSFELPLSGGTMSAQWRPAGGALDG